MSEEKIKEILQEIKDEQQIPSFFNDQSLINYIKEWQFN